MIVRVSALFVFNLNELYALILPSIGKCCLKNKFPFFNVDFAIHLSLFEQVSINTKLVLPLGSMADGQLVKGKI
jgi:hypothetical protein